MLENPSVNLSEQEVHTLRVSVDKHICCVWIQAWSFGDKRRWKLCCVFWEFQKVYKPTWTITAEHTGMYRGRREEVAQKRTWRFRPMSQSTKSRRRMKERRRRDQTCWTSGLNGPRHRPHGHLWPSLNPRVHLNDAVTGTWFRSSWSRSHAGLWTRSLLSLKRHWLL